MGSLYSQYVKEREGLFIIENDYGFLTYSLKNDILFIHDLFVTKEKRKSNIAFQMLDESMSKAKELGIIEMYAHVDIRALNWEESVSFIEKFGAKPTKLEGTLLYFKKKIG